MKNVLRHFIRRYGHLWKEAKYFVEELHASNMQAILALTKNCAELCGILETTGTLEVGKAADIVAVEGNPLLCIDHLKNVRMVVKGGVIQSPAAGANKP